MKISSFSVQSPSFIAVLALGLGLSLAACDDSDNDAPQGGDQTDTKRDIGIGNGCSCEATEDNVCDAMGVPLPSPVDDRGKLVGCDAIDDTGITGAKRVCLRTIDAQLSAIAPTVYAPKGYCSLSAVKAGMENETFKQFVEYGDADAFTQCPKGSALLASTFDYKILGSDATITIKTCVKICNTDADCNVEGEMTCLERKGVKFCYHEDNLKLSDNYTVTPF